MIQRFALPLLLVLLCLSAPAAGPLGEMVLIPAGPFRMGHGAKPPLGPAREVTLAAYWIDRTEATVGAYKQCVAAGACQWNPNATSHRFFRDDQPMVLVSWRDARGYCLSIGKRLPSEAQWEKAARGDDGRAFPWGAYAPDRANLADATAAPVDIADYRFTWPVGAAAGDVSPYGVRDLAGNVNEWTADPYRADYHQTTDATDPRVTAADQDAEGQLARTVRGGSFADGPDDGAAYRRDGQRHAAGRGLKLGFRCAKDAKP